jgi:hypothetical protein
MPIGCSGGSESPDESFAAQSRLHMVILCEIKLVIKVDKVVFSHLPVRGKGGDEKK